MPEESERLKMWSRDGPMELKTSFKIVVGMMSSGLVEVFIQSQLKVGLLNVWESYLNSIILSRVSKFRVLYFII